MFFIYFSEIYLQITRSSNGVNTMDRKIGWIYQNNVQQKRGTVAGLTCPGVLY